MDFLLNTYLLSANTLQSCPWSVFLFCFHPLPLGQTDDKYSTLSPHVLESSHKAGFKYKCSNKMISGFRKLRIYRNPMLRKLLLCNIMLKLLPDKLYTLHLKRLNFHSSSQERGGFWKNDKIGSIKLEFLQSTL